MLQAYFPAPTAPTKFHPITTMKQLFQALTKDETALVIKNECNNN